MEHRTSLLALPWTLKNIILLKYQAILTERFIKIAPVQLILSCTLRNTTISPLQEQCYEEMKNERKRLINFCRDDGNYLPGSIRDILLVLHSFIFQSSVSKKVCLLIDLAHTTERWSRIPDIFITAFLGCEHLWETIFQLLERLGGYLHQLTPTRLPLMPLDIEIFVNNHI